MIVESRSTIFGCWASIYTVVSMHFVYSHYKRYRETFVYFDFIGSRVHCDILHQLYRNGCTWDQPCRSAFQPRTVLCKGTKRSISAANLGLAPCCGAKLTRVHSGILHWWTKDSSIWHSQDTHECPRPSGSCMNHFTNRLSILRYQSNFTHFHKVCYWLVGVVSVCGLINSSIGNLHPPTIRSLNSNFRCGALEDVQ